MFFSWLNVNGELTCVCFPRTALHYAAANCNYQCLFALVGSGASVNDLDERGCTPLHYAAASDTDGKWVMFWKSFSKGLWEAGHVWGIWWLKAHSKLWEQLVENGEMILQRLLSPLQVPGIFTAKWCESRDPRQSGLQCCALRLCVRPSPLSGAGENLTGLFLLLFSPAEITSSSHCNCIMINGFTASPNHIYRLQVKLL